MTDRERVARRLVALARLVAEEDGEEEVDPKFVEKVRSLKKALARLASKKKRKLGQYGVGVIKSTNTVEDLVDALMRVVSA
jgi:hypothetical protein